MAVDHRRSHDSLPVSSTAGSRARPWVRTRLGLAACGVAALLAAAATARASNVAWFTSQAAFNASLEANYAGALDSLGPNPLADPLPFSGLTAGTGTFSFQATSSAGLYSVFNGPRALSPDGLETLLVFEGFSPAVRAFGGLFSLTDLEEQRQSGTFTLSIFTGSGTAQTLLTSTSATVTVSGPSFLGLIDFAPAVSFSRVELGTPSTTLFPTAEQVTIGVPEPSAFAGLSTGVVLAAIAFRVRSRLRKAACALIATAAFAIPAHAALAAIPFEPTQPFAVEHRPSWPGPVCGKTRE